ncbi:MAG: hypothetical protein OXB88_08755 [Bacteriovoracales bacterium]|nr:hypothetical protein [Bacteriovoracales bacterium]
MWLIRTKDNEIVGPLPKEKVLALYKDKTISDNDEICMANSHWFYIHEKELLKKYLLGDKEESFESPSLSQNAHDSSDQGAKFPDSSDLDFPETPATYAPEESSDITLISNSILNKKEKASAPAPSPSPSPQEREKKNEPSDSTSTPIARKFKTPYPPNAQISTGRKKKAQRDDRYLMILFFITLILLGIVIKKYIFFLTGQILLGPYSYASQSAPPLFLQKEVLFQSSLGQLVSNPGVNGVKFEIDLKKNVDHCLLFEKKSFPIVWYLTEKEEKIDKCSHASAEAVTIFNFSKIFSEKKISSIEGKISKVFGPGNAKKIITIHQKKRQQNKKSFIIEDVLEQVNLFLENKNTTSSKKILKILNEIKSHILSKIAQMAIYHKLGNKGRMHQLLDSILSSDKDFFLIMGEVNTTSKNSLKLEQQLFSLIKFLSEILSENEFKFMKTYLKSYWPDFIEKHFPTSLSLNEIRRLSQTFRWGISYPSLWVEALQSRSTQNDIHKYLERVFAKNRSKDFLKNHFWVFSFYTPFSDDIKSFIKEEMRKLYKSRSPYDKFLFLKVMSNSNLYEFLKKSLRIRTSPFNLKRKMFRSILEVDHIINFSLLHLIALGDRNEDLLWWKIL